VATSSTRAPCVPPLGQSLWQALVAGTMAQYIWQGAPRVVAGVAALAKRPSPLQLAHPAAGGASLARHLATRAWQMCAVAQTCNAQAPKHLHIAL